MNLSIVGIIPARYASTRFPGKPLADIDGTSMIRRVYEQACKSAYLSEVYVATDDERIYNDIVKDGGKAIIKDIDFKNGTERCLHAFGELNASGSFDYLVNIQGDEPFIHPKQIDELCETIARTDAPIATLIKKAETNEELWNENTVKVTCDHKGKALYFSRNPIPFTRSTPKEKWVKEGEYYTHVGIYAFKAEAIAEIQALKPSRLEIAESLEQLRWLESGLSIQTHVTSWESISVDTPEDLEKARAYAVKIKNA